MQIEIDNYISKGQADFSVLVLVSIGIFQFMFLDMTVSNILNAITSFLI